MLRLGTQFYTKCLTSNCFKPTSAHEELVKKGLYLSSPFVRTTTFFNKLTADELWKGVTSVSAAGQKRGRGRGTDKKGKKNLNFGQRIGFGKDKMLWPGLSAPVLHSNTVIKIQKLPEHAESITEKSDFTRKHIAIHPLERGWSGRKIEGKYLNIPECFEQNLQDEFKTVIIENRLVPIMTGNLGRKRMFLSIALAGNGKGLIGMGKGRGAEPSTAMHIAKCNAMNHLVSLDFLEDHTVNHDFFCNFGRTKVFVFKQPKGYGIRCHRVLKACCELIGIKDMTAKVVGPSNIRHVVKAFLIGLMQQKSYQAMADEKKLHLVEYRPERLYYPEVKASPDVCLNEEQVKDEEKNFGQYIYNGRILYRRPRFVPFFEKLPSWQKHLKRSLYYRNHAKVKVELMAEYGQIQSFLSDIYPDCRNRKPKKAEEEM